MTAKFLRVDSNKYSKLGVRRKKKQKYRKPTGRDNKIRLNYAGRLRKVRIGFKNEKTGRGLIEGMKPIVVNNVNDLNKIGEGMIGLLGKIGNKRRKEIAEAILKKDVKLLKFNAKKVLDKIEEKIRVRKEKRIEKKKFKDKKSKQKEDKKKSDKIVSDKKDEEKLENKIKEKNDEKSENERKVKESKIKEDKNELK